MKNEILRGYGSFDLVFKNGRSLQKSHTILFYLKADEKRIGFVVSKRIRKAVHRNRLKRKLREIYRQNKNFFPEKYHCILLARGTSYDFQELKNQILELVSEMRRTEKIGE
ncbi:MAG: ribonuclease P protein component [Calditrichaeota bacterium]|nr:ribonuclease P protein component [Calditrichota bacterium]